MNHEVTASSSPRERRHDENLRKILGAAMTVVEEGGLRALSVNKLAALVDYTPGALYRYFPSKDALLSALGARVLTDLGDSFESALSLLPARSSPLVRFLTLAAAYRAFAADEPSRFALLALSVAEPKALLADPKHLEPVIAAALALVLPVAEALEEAAERGHLARGTAAERAICAFAMLQGILQLHKQVRHAPDLLDLERLATDGLTALLVGWGAEPRGVKTALSKVPRVADLRVRSKESI